MKDKKAVVNRDRCIGCGLCTSTCKTGALALQGQNKIKITPKNHGALYLEIMKKKYGTVRMAYALAKYKMGIKV